MTNNLQIFSENYKDYNKLLIDSSNKYLFYQKLTNTLNKIINKYRFTQIKKLIKAKYTLDEIAESINLNKNTIRTINRYGIKTCSSSVKNTVRNRDNNICSICKNKQINKKLLVHHIFDSTNHKEDNLMTVCSSCHLYLHKLKDNSGTFDLYKKIIKDLNKTKKKCKIFTKP